MISIWWSEYALQCSNYVIRLFPSLFRLTHLFLFFLKTKISWRVFPCIRYFCVCFLFAATKTRKSLFRAWCVRESNFFYNSSVLFFSYLPFEIYKCGTSHSLCDKLRVVNFLTPALKVFFMAPFYSVRVKC